MFYWNFRKTIFNVNFYEISLSIYLSFIKTFVHKIFDETEVLFTYLLIIHSIIYYESEKNYY